MKKSHMIESTTVIIVLYYSKHLLKALISNILDTMDNVGEIILVDNSNENLLDYETNIVKILTPKENIGYGGAINYGVKFAKNEMILIINPDIYLEKFSIPRELNVDGSFVLSAMPNEWSKMRAFPTVFNDVLMFSFGYLGKIFKFLKDNFKKIYIDDSLNIQAVDWVSGSLILTNKKTMLTLNGFDEGYFLFYEEVDFCKRASIKNIPVYITKNITFSSNQGTASAADVSEIKHKSCIESAQKYHKLYNGQTLTKFLFLFVKLFSFFVYRGLRLLSIYVKTSKITNKAKQYSIYYDNI